MLKQRTRRLSRRIRGYELVVHEAAWEGTIRLTAGEAEAMMWQQLRRPVRFARWPARAGEMVAPSGPELPGLWRYHDVWYAASGDATPSTVLDAVEAAQRAESQRLAAPADESVGRFIPESWLDPMEQQEAARQREETFQFPYVGRLVWKRFLAELTECARLERLVITYEADPHFLSVGLMVTLRGDSRALTRFAAFSEGLLIRYSVPPGG